MKFLLGKFHQALREHPLHLVLLGRLTAARLSPTIPAHTFKTFTILWKCVLFTQPIYFWCFMGAYFSNNTCPCIQCIHFRISRITQDHSENVCYILPMLRGSIFLKCNCKCEWVSVDYSLYVFMYKCVENMKIKH